jgi:hypothetical protein
MISIIEQDILYVLQQKQLLCAGEQGRQVKKRLFLTVICII